MVPIQNTVSGYYPEVLVNRHNFMSEAITHSCANERFYPSIMGYRGFTQVRSAFMPLSSRALHKPPETPVMTLSERRTILRGRFNFVKFRVKSVHWKSLFQKIIYQHFTIFYSILCELTPIKLGTLFEPMDQKNLSIVNPSTPRP